jgi:uncharacterized protein YfaP (DUF2135 family)
VRVQVISGAVNVFRHNIMMRVVRGELRDSDAMEAMAVSVVRGVCMPMPTPCCGMGRRSRRALLAA